MIYVMLMTTAHIKPVKHPPFQYKTWGEAKAVVEEMLNKGCLHAEDVFIPIEAGTAVHIASDEALARQRKEGFTVKAWNVLVCPLNSAPLPPFPADTKEQAETVVRQTLVLGRHLRASLGEEDEFSYIHAPGTIYLILSKEDCIKRLAVSGDKANGGSRIIQ